MRSVLHGIRGPQDLRGLSVEELSTLSQEIRDFLIEKVSRSGGHLGPNLGVVELTVALHRVFDCTTDVLLWDTGHQSYVHKMLTGRLADFDSLRQEGGMSGYPSRAESDADVIENSHASTVLSYADGIARAFELQGVLPDRHVVAVVGDGALTGGMSWEALNNIAGSPDRPVVMVVNDNERSYSPTIGGLAHHLSTLRTTHGYERFLDWGRRALTGTPVVGQPMYDTLHAVKAGLKDALAPQGLFEDLGLKYIGPIDGHDIPALEHALNRAKAYAGPVIVHVITEKGRGYSFAEADVAEKFHAVAAMDPETGLPLKAGVPTWTGAFSKELVAIGEEREDVVAITAAMLGPTGLERFAHAFPDRTIDVGIAEQHAATSAAGMAFAGLHPVVAVYATFLNRAFDQVLMDCALHRAGVTFVLDRAGVTGDDGASHNGVWDLAVLQVVPGLRIAAPRDAQTLTLALREAVDVADAPTVVRFPKGALPADIAALERTDDEDVLYRNGSDDVLVISVGALAPLALDVADRLVDQGIGVTVVDPRWVSPVAASLVERASGFSLVVVVEDGVRAGGVAGAITRAMQDAGVDVPLRGFGVPVEFLDHGSRANVLSRIGLTAQDVSRAVVEAVARREPPFTGVESGSADPAPRQGTGSV